MSGDVNIENKYSLIHIDKVGLSVKADGLLDKIITAFSPRRSIEMAEATEIRRKIRNEAELANKRRNELAAVDLQFELRERADTLGRLERIRQQENMEDIVRLALPEVRPEATPDQMDDDWISRFFERCRNVTNDRMQDLWARILAGEANRPGSFTKRTLECVSILDQDDALAFARLCNFIVVANQLVPLVTTTQAEIYTKNGVDDELLLELDSIGLISVQIPAGFKTDAYPDVIAYGTKRIVVVKLSHAPLPLGSVVFTGTGHQLATICKREEIPGFAEHIVNYWRSHAATVHQD